MAIVFKSFGWRLRILFVMLIVETPLPADFAFIAGTGFGGLMSRSENRAGQGVMIRRISNLHVVTRLRSLGALRAVGTIEYSDEVNESKLPPRPDGPDPFSISRAEINGLKEKIKRLVEGSLKTGENRILKQISWYNQCGFSPVMHRHYCLLRFMLGRGWVQRGAENGSRK